MRTGLFGGVLVSCAVLFVAGCAKEHVVRKEEAPFTKPAPPVTKPETAPIPTPAPAPPVETVPGKTPAGEPVGDATGTKLPDSARQEEAARRSALAKVYFDYDSADLSQAARNGLNKNYDLLKKSGDRLEIEGHCDERGSDEYNLALGERRAKAVKSYLVTLGIQPDRLTTISYGKEKPADPAHTEEAWAKNRRAEFMIKK